MNSRNVRMPQPEGNMSELQLLIGPEAASNRSSAVAAQIEAAAAESRSVGKAATDAAPFECEAKYYPV